MSRYDWLLFLHVLSAFAIVGSVVVFTVALTDSGSRLTPLARRLFDVGAGGTILFGVWLALDQYDIFDGWILAALALWVIAAGTGSRLGGLLQRRPEGQGQVGLFYGLTVVAVAALLMVMIYKPGA